MRTPLPAPQKFYYIFRMTALSIEPLNLSDWDGEVDRYEFDNEADAEDWIATYFKDANDSPSYSLVILPVWHVNSKK